MKRPRSDHPVSTEIVLGVCALLLMLGCDREEVVALSAQGSLGEVSIEFGEVPVGGSALRAVMLSNLGNTALRLSAVELQKFDGIYELEIEGGAVPAYGEARLLVRFTPIAVAPYPDTATLLFAAPASGSLELELHGAGVADCRDSCTEPRIQVEPVLLDFGVLPSGQQATGRFELHNRGSATLNVSALAITPPDAHYTIDHATLPLALAPQESAPVEVRFAPQSAGVHSARVEISCDDRTSPHGHVELIGVRSDAALALVPASLEFGVLEGEGPVERQLLLVNRGAEPVQIEQLSLDGDTAFELGAPGSTPFTLGLGATASLSVRFRPLSAGDHHARLWVSSDVPHTPVLEATLAGTRGQRGCLLTTGADAVRFGNVQLGSRSSIDVTLRNQGTDRCTISAVDFSPLHLNDPAFTFGQPSARDIDPGERVTLGVGFSPGDPGLAKAVLRLTLSAPEAPELLIGLSGQGAMSGLVAVPPTLVFAPQLTGCAQALETVTLQNIGQTGLTVAPLRLDPVGSDAFSLESTPVVGALLPGASRPVQLRFAPTEVRAHLGALIAQVVETGEEVRVPLSGRALPALAPLETETFVAAGTRAVDVLFVIDNSGSMGDDQANLAANFQSFLQFADLSGEEVDFQIAVTTTDVDPGGAQGLLVGTPPILSRETPELEQRFADSVQVGAGGSGWEQGLQAAYLALSPPLLTSAGVSAGLLREAAALALILVSDEDDQSPRNVGFYVSYFQGLKGSSEGAPPVMMTAITGGSAGCDSDLGHADPAPRYSLAMDLAGGRWMEICTADWGAELEDLGGYIFLARRQFQLSGDPDPGSVSVRVNGVLIDHEIWSYDPTSRSVVFGLEHLPEPGDIVEVTYAVSC